MPKIPTFTAEGSITQLAGTTNAPQIGLNQTLATALAPATKMLVNQKIQETNAQNQAEALKLENNFITDFIKVSDTINTDEVMSTNKDVANKYLKDQSNALISKYKSLATNNNVGIKFENYALAETQKTIFRTDTQISKNILKNLFNGYDKQKELLVSTAKLNGGIDNETLQTDLEKLTIDTFTSQVSAPELKVMLDSIPGEIQLHDANAMIQQEPRNLLFALKDAKNFPDITYENKVKLMNQAKLVLTPQINDQWNNVLAASAAGKDIPYFDMDLAKEVLPADKINKYMQKKYIIDTTVDNKKILFSAPNKDLADIVENFKEEAIILVGEKNAQPIIQEYETALINRSTALNEDPAKFIYTTNSEIDELNIQLNNETNVDAQSSLKLQITEALINAQTKLGVPEHKQKVMTNTEAINFVETYKLKSQDNAAESKAMLASLRTNFGEFDSKALQELQAAGLPFTASFVMSGFVNDIEAEKFFGFDSKVEQDKLKDWGKRNDIKFSDIEAEIATNSDLQKFENIIRRNNNIDSSQAVSAMDNVQNVLSYYALNEMYTNTKFDQGDAVESASNMFLKNFQIEDTYYIPLKYDGKDLTEFGTTAGAVKDKAELIKEYYIEDFNPVAFRSTDPFNQGVSEQELSDKHKRMMRMHGEWRNKGDGTGLVFGVVLDGGQFAPVVNADGKELSFNFNDTSYILPGTDIEMDIKKLRVTDVPTEYEIGQIKGYSGFTVNEGEATNNNIDNNIYNEKSFESYIKTVENDKLLNGSFKNFRHKSPEGGLDTIGFGHKLTSEEQKTNTVYNYDLSKITKDNFLEISNDILRQDLKKTEKILITTHGNKFINLDGRRKQMLIDMQFNVRNFNKPEVFKKFKKALFAGDEEGMKKEYKRVFTDKNGIVKPLARNEFFKKYFLDK